MKRIVLYFLAIALLFVCLPVYTYAEDTDFLIGDWATADGTYLSLYDDGTFEMKWDFFPVEEGHWSVNTISDDTFFLEMDGSLILTIMSKIYGSGDSDYHFEILKCDSDNFYLVQVYGSYTAKTSPCKLGFTRTGTEENFSYSEDESQPNQGDNLKRKKTRNGNLVIKSDYENNRQFSFKDNEEFEDLILSSDSMQYDPRLAHCLACLARSSYNKDLIFENYADIGFYYDDIIQRYYDEDGNVAAFTIGKKELDDGSLFVLITVRGTNEPEDWLTDFDIELKKNNLSTSVGLHTGFYRSETALHEKLEDFLGGSLPKKNVTYVITGHSLGAAVGNLLSLELYTEGVSSSDVYNYNFACPLVGAGPSDESIWNNKGEHNNIININNWFDIVPSRPMQINYSVDDTINNAMKGWTHFKRFGVSYWFDNGFMHYFDAHNMCAYIDYLQKLNDTSHFRSGEYVVNVVSARCPVDIDIYDSDGNLIVGTVNDEPNYYDYDEGEKASVFVDGDKKTFYILNDDKCEIRLHATDEGEMEFNIYSIDLINNEVLSEKHFNPVTLTADKEMLCEYGGKKKASSAKLYSVNDDNKVLTEIMEDGTEKKATFKWKYLFIIISVIVLITAAVILVIFILKKKEEEKRKRSTRNAKRKPTGTKRRRY